MLTTTHKLTQNSAKPISTRVVSSTPGRLRVRVEPQHRSSGEMQRIADALSAQPNINQVQFNSESGSITINHDSNNTSLKNVFATLKDLGIIFAAVTEGNTEAAAQVASAANNLNNIVKQATNGTVDIRFLFPLGLSTLAVRQLIANGLEFETIPWYVLAWYAFDSFIKLHGSSQTESSRE